MSAAPRVLALNLGSSSLKFALFEAPPGAPLVPLRNGQAPGESPAARVQGLLGLLRAQLSVLGGAGPAAVGHRIVHGGLGPRVHGLIGPDMLATLQAAAASAPLHTPDALALVRACAVEFPGALQVACDDSQFHAHLPPVALTLPLPAAVRGPGVVRLGFHGLSCQSVLRQLGPACPRRLVIAHLGQGASVTAVLAGQSVDTSMGLTPLGGCLMGTRSGDLDPGVLLHLLRQQPADPEGLARLLSEHSGMLGISGLSGDLRQLRPAANAGHAGAQLAIACFARAVAKQVAGMACALGGLDLLVFTGGMAEHDEGLRTAICADLAWMGLLLDADRNRRVENPLDAAASRCAVRLLPCRENEEIAHQAAQALAPPH